MKQMIISVLVIATAYIGLVNAACTLKITAGESRHPTNSTLPALQADSEAACEKICEGVDGCTASVEDFGSCLMFRSPVLEYFPILGLDDCKSKCLKDPKCQSFDHFKTGDLKDCFHFSTKGDGFAINKGEAYTFGIKNC